jgi:hypothetical protein
VMLGDLVMLADPVTWGYPVTLALGGTGFR